MLVILACHAGDIQDASRLIRWIKQLGGCKGHSLLIVADGGTPHGDVIKLREEALPLFDEVRPIGIEQSVKGWPDGANALFKEAIEYVAKSWPQPFLWLEPDAVPLCRNWLDRIAENYAISGKPLMGHQYDCHQPRLPKRLLSGVAVYPADAADRIFFLKDTARPWDVDNAESMVLNSKDSPLFWHFWGQPGLPPTFIEKRVEGSPINAFTLDRIPEGAVLFHRNKDGTLIRLLREKLFPGQVEKRDPVTVVFHVCNSDIALAIQHARWMKKLGHAWAHDAIIAHDLSINITQLNQFKNLLAPQFSKVSLFAYPVPRTPGWPMAPNWAWQHVANEMSRQKRSWLWMEADCVVLKADWIEQLQFEYERSGAAFMGPKVKGMAHFNGGSIYPAITPELIPSAMRATTQAWDYVCGAEMMPHAHDASHLMQHVWTIVGENAIETGGGEAPAGITLAQAKRWIKPGAVVIHRIKDNSLINLLTSGAL